MRQRVAFLRTLLSGKPVLCLDEPFGALDAITRAEMQGWLARTLEREPRTVVLVTHDVEEAVVLADRVAVLSPAPGHLRAEIEVDLPRPRSRTDAAVVALRERALGWRWASLGGSGSMRRRVAQRAARDRARAGAARRVGALRRLGRHELLDPPAPHTIAEALWGNAGLLGHNLAVTAEEVALGLALALALGFALGVLIHLSPPLRRAIYPLTVGSQAVPIAVIAPLLVFLLGFGLLPKLIVIVLICFFPVVVTTVDGLAAVDPDQLKLLRTLDASRWQAFRFAELPAALPAAISGARIAVTVGVIGAYIAESQTATSRRLRRTGTRDQRRPQLAADLARLRGRGRAVRLRDRLLLRPRPGRAPAGAVGQPIQEETSVESPADRPPHRVARRAALALLARPVRLRRQAGHDHGGPAPSPSR